MSRYDGAVDVVEYPTEGVFDFTLEERCGCCDACPHPKIEKVSGGINASGRYRVKIIPTTDNG